MEVAVVRILLVLSQILELGVKVRNTFQTMKTTVAVLVLRQNPL